MSQNILRPVDFVTAYGARKCRLAAQFAGQSDPYHQITLPETLRMLDRVSFDMREQPNGLPENYSLTVAGQVRNLDEMSEILRTKAAQLSLQAIHTFEQGFKKSVDPQNIIASYQSGERESRILVQRFSMFPTEGANVWGEFAIPEYAFYQSQDLQNHIENLFMRRMHGYSHISLHGPVIPALREEVVMDLLKNQLPKMRREILDLINQKSADVKPTLN